MAVRPANGIRKITRDSRQHPPLIINPFLVIGLPEKMKMGQWDECIFLPLCNIMNGLSCV
jgi:hypothetical protein